MTLIYEETLHIGGRHVGMLHRRILTLLLLTFALTLLASCQAEDNGEKEEDTPPPYSLPTSDKRIPLEYDEDFSQLLFVCRDHTEHMETDYAYIISGKGEHFRFG